MILGYFPASTRWDSYLSEALSRQQKLEAQLEHAQNRQFAAEQKQQQEADSSRELIRTLRTELQQQQEAHQLQLQSMEERMMEFKLKFEYAQKQLKVTS